MPGRTFTREFKLTIVRQLASGEKRPAQVCREHGLADSVLARWRREYTERGDAAFTPKAGTNEASPLEARIAALERFCGQLALENAVLRKALQAWQSGHPGMAGEVFPLGATHHDCCRPAGLSAGLDSPTLPLARARTHLVLYLPDARRAGGAGCGAARCD